jgi:hypothetical protein
MYRRRSWLSPVRILILGACGFWGFGVLTAAFWNAQREQAAPQVAPLLEKIQQLGQLHTVRYNLHDIYRHERAIEPEGFWREIPGVRSLYRATTKNTVMVVAEGGVEAGIDLSKVSADDVSHAAAPDGVKLRVRLPRATLFPPDVKVRVVNRESGIFWRDENIVPEATEAIKSRFIEAAQSRRILAEAETNAIKLLTQMHDLTGNNRVEFTF